VIELVDDEMPFLVESTTMEINGKTWPELSHTVNSTTGDVASLIASTATARA